MAFEKIYAIEIEEVFKKLGSNTDGLDENEVKKRLINYGPNELTVKKKKTVLQMLVDQFKDFLIWLLIAAAVISLMLYAFKFEESAWMDSLVIFAILFANAAIGVYQENKSEKSLEALKRMAAPQALVRRNKKQVKIPARDVVPGDILILNTGDKIAADTRIYEAINLKIEQAILTGESVPVKKTNKIQPEEASLSERKNMAYASTIVTYGRGEGIVVSTGMKTEVGKIAEMIQEFEEKETPLQKKMNKLSKSLGIIVIIICIAVFITGITRFIITLGYISINDLTHLFAAAIGLAVAAVPEGLPAVVTISLALGVTRMSVRHAIIRKLPAVETLGCATTICSDKTGTLTKNQMTIQKIYVNNKVIDVTGIGYEPKGKFYILDDEILPNSMPELVQLIKIAALCNDSSLILENNEFNIYGDPTEGCLVVLAEKAGLPHDELKKNYPRVGELPFDSKRKLMTTIHKDEKNEYYAFTKGAPEQIIAKSIKIYSDSQIEDLSEAVRNQLIGVNKGMAEEALRGLGYAYKKLDTFETSDEEELSFDIENDLIFVGMTFAIDPARPEIKDAIRLTYDAGIKTIMITGDNPDTAKAIGFNLGLIHHRDSKVYTGAELDNLSDEELREVVNTNKIFARTSPEHKVRICASLQDNNQVVAMTGDGVNDAPALKKADIGVAMGITGTEVAKEAADMILADDNFATIVNAVEEGRIIYDNIRKFIFFLLSCNTGEILTMFIASLMGFAVYTGLFTLEFILPLNAITILWVNLITDGLPATSFSLEPGDPNIMEQKPRDPDEGVVPRRSLINMMIIGAVIATGTLTGFFIYIRPFINSNSIILEHDLWRAYTIAFTTLVMFEMFRAFGTRSLTKSIFKIKTHNKWLYISVAISIAMQCLVIYTPGIQNAFKTVPLDFTDWLIVLSISVTIIPVVEIQKLFWNWRDKKIIEKIEKKIQF
ncbi:MAG: calcium-translocating P-type ATPase, SERCA-type [Candidatus Helarchaeota archaeon]